MKDITIDVTYAELTALIAANGLFQGVNYLITDRGDRGLLFKAASTSQLEIQGTRYMLCPATYAIGADTHGNNWIGVWNSAKTAALNDLTIWNGQVWKCILAVTEPLDSPDLNAVNWVLMPKATFMNYEYKEMMFTVSYDVSNDWISRQWDENGNIFGLDFMSYSLDPGIDNPVNITDWNCAKGEESFINNKCVGIYNNSNSGYIQNNSCFGIIALNTNAGNIINNIVTQIYNNSNVGNIRNNKNNGYISNNTSGVNPCEIKFNNCNGNISGIWTADVSDINEDKIGV